jgi:hypothetical protein
MRGARRSYCHKSEKEAFESEGNFFWGTGYSLSLGSHRKENGKPGFLF